MRSKLLKFTIALFAVSSGALVFIFTPGKLLRGRRGGKLLFVLSLLPMLTVYYGFLAFFMRKKRKESTLLSKLLVKNDPDWELASIQGRIKEIFTSLQQAMQKKNSSLLQPYVSDEVFVKISHFLNQEQASPHALVYEGIVLREQTVVCVTDYLEDSKDALWATVSYRMKKYPVDRETQRPLGKKPFFKEMYNELWRLSCHPQKGWILDDRRESITLSQLLALQSFSESYPKKFEEPLAVDIGRALADYEWIFQNNLESPELPQLHSPYLALAIGLLAPWAIVLIFFLRVFYGGR